jgi:hypothetical protein
MSICSCIYIYIGYQAERMPTYSAIIHLSVSHIFINQTYVNRTSIYTPTYVYLSIILYLWFQSCSFPWNHSEYMYLQIPRFVAPTWRDHHSRRKRAALRFAIPSIIVCAHISAMAVLVPELVFQSQARAVAEHCTQDVVCTLCSVFAWWLLVRYYVGR